MPPARPTKKRRSNGKEEDDESRRICNLYQCVLRSELDALVEKKDPKALKSLAALFPAAKYPDVKKTEHCVYCCTMFDPRDKNTKCSIAHEIDDCSRDCKHSRGSDWSATCVRCGETFEGSSSDYDEPPEDLGKGFCYKGHHNSSEDAFEQVLEWHTERNGEEEPFGCKKCEARRIQFLQEDDEDDED